MTDADDIEESNAYFIETERNLTNVKSYIKTRDNPILASNKKCSCSTDSKVSVLKLPSVPKPEVFVGDSESYPMWRAAFNTLVDKHEIDFDAKMYYL